MPLQSVLYKCFTNCYTLMVFTWACPKNSACTYGNMMWTALCTDHAQGSRVQCVDFWQRSSNLCIWYVGTFTRLHLQSSQYITDEMFKQLVKQQYKLPATTMEACSLPPLGYQEQNAVRYAAGYTVRHLRQCLGRGSHQLKEELVLCLEEMCDDRQLLRC